MAGPSRSDLRRGWSRRTVLVGLAYAATVILFVLANKLTTAANSIFLQSTAPLYILLLGPWLLREQIQRREILIMTLVAVGLGMFFLGIQSPQATAPDPLRGNILAVLLLALVGGAVFISIGFAISGWAKSEEVAAPIANVIALPMMFLSGVFFPREAMPQVLQGVTDYLPLTYLAEALRSVAIDGATLWSQWLNLTGLAVWLAVSFVLAVRLFRWE